MQAFIIPAQLGHIMHMTSCTIFPIVHLISYEEWKQVGNNVLCRCRSDTKHNSTSICYLDPIFNARNMLEFERAAQCMRLPSLQGLRRADVCSITSMCGDAISVYQSCDIQITVEQPCHCAKARYFALVIYTKWQLVSFSLLAGPLPCLINLSNPTLSPSFTSIVLGLSNATSIHPLSPFSYLKPCY